MSRPVRCLWMLQLHGVVTEGQVSAAACARSGCGCVVASALLWLPTVTLGMHGQKCPYHSFINELVAIERNCKQSPNKVSLDLALKVIPDSRGVPVVHSIEKPSRVQTVYGQKSVAYTNSDGTGKPAAFGTYITRPSRSGVKSCVYPSMFHALKHC